MSNKNKGLVPRLRFPEFSEYKQWEDKTLGDLASVVRGGSPRPIESFLTNEANGLNWLKIGDVDKEAKYVTKTQDKVLPEALNSSREVVPGDLILSNSMSFGRPYIMQIKSCIRDGWIAITRPSELVSREYLYYFIFSPNSQVYFLNNAAGSGVLNLNAEIIKALPVAFPSSKEQLKISDCLSSLDVLISAQADKLEALKTHKKGLMQQLFPQDGEAIPRLRFAEFRDSEEWVREELCHCLDKVIDYRGKAPPKAESGVPLITAKNVRFGWLDMSCDEYVDTDAYANWMSKGIPKAGDILFTTEAPLGNVAKFPISGQFALGQRIITLRAKTKKCLPEFLFHSLLSYQIQKEIELKSTGSTAKGIKSSVFVKIEFCYPKIPEQQKIADCLSSLDELIAAEAEKLEALKTHKKGLMQQLFPVLVETEA